MRILFTAPRFHTNQVPVVRGLIGAGHDVRYFVVFTGATEDHSACVPTVLPSSRATLREERTLERKGRSDEVESVIGGRKHVSGGGFPCPGGNAPRGLRGSGQARGKRTGRVPVREGAAVL